jgi:peroxiredoxin
MMNFRRETIMRIANLFLFLVLMAGIAEGGQSAGSRAPDFSLLDQRDNQVSLNRLEGQVVVLIACDDEGTKQNPDWKKAIEQYRNRANIFGVADVRKVPLFLKNKFKRDFQKDASTILLDWEGVIFTSYELAKEVANIVVIDKRGIIRYHYSGRAEPAAVEGLRAALDESLE